MEGMISLAGGTGYIVTCMGKEGEIRKRLLITPDSSCRLHINPRRGAATRYRQSLVPYLLSLLSLFCLNLFRYF
jgi:hypothetical protein